MNALLSIYSGLAAFTVVSEVIKGRAAGLYRWRSTLVDLGCGALYGLVQLGSRGVIALIYFVVHWLCAPVAAPPLWASTAGAVAAFVLYDGLYYASHRLAHNTNLLWANHAVHHQPKHFNLAIGLRVGAFSSWFDLPFHLLLALAGVPTEIYLAIVLIHAGMMLVLHARFVGNLGVLGLLFNTPSHHRVHHSVDKAHHDHNYGGVLIIWDRLFGTFKAEPAEALKFGLAPTTPDAATPLQANWVHFGWLRAQLSQSRGLRNKWRLLMAKPGRTGKDTRRPSLGMVLRVAAALFTAAVALWRMDAGPATWLLMVLPAMLLADLLSGVIHATFDRLEPRADRWWGRIAQEFHEHHDQPTASASYSFCESTHNVALVALPMFLGAILLAPSHASLATLMLLVGAFSMLAPQAHKWAHMHRPPGVVGALQRARLLIPPGPHDKHHSGSHRQAFCVLTGWCNPLLDRMLR